MDKELEKYMFRKMIIGQNASETYRYAEDQIKAIHGYGNMNWYKKAMFNIQLSNVHSDLFKSLKKIQSDLIDAIIKSKKGSSYTGSGKQ